MDRADFLRQIFTVCGVRDGDKNLIKTYDIALNVPYKVNWEAFFHYCMQEITKKSLPMPSFFTSQIERFKDFSANQYDGYQIRVYFNSGRFTDFTICGFGLSFSQIKEKCQNSDKVVKAVMYAPDVALMASGKIVPEDAKGNIVYVAP